MADDLTAAIATEVRADSFERGVFAMADAVARAYPYPQTYSRALARIARALIEIERAALPPEPRPLD